MVHRTLFADVDFERFIDDYKEKLDEEYDEDGFETIDTTVDDYFDNMDETGSPIDRPSSLNRFRFNEFEPISLEQKAYRASNRGSFKIW